MSLPHSPQSVFALTTKADDGNDGNGDEERESKGQDCLQNHGLVVSLWTDGH